MSWPLCKFSACAQDRQQVPQGCPTRATVRTIAAASWPRRRPWAAGRNTSVRWPRRTAPGPIPRSPAGLRVPAPHPSGPAPRPGPRRGAGTCRPRTHPPVRSRHIAQTPPGGTTAQLEPGIHADRVIARRDQHRNEAAQRPAPEFDHAGWRGRQLAADERPRRCQPPLIRRHTARAYPALPSPS